jgi:hypothetical protein
MNDQTQDRFAKMFLKNMIEFMNNNSDEFGLNNIISPVSGNSFLTEVNKLSEVVSSDIPIEEGLKNLIKLDNVITNNEITDNVITDSVITNNEITDNVITDSVITNNEITDNIITDNVITNNEITDNVITDKETNISSEPTLLVKEDDEAWIVNNIKILKDPRCCHNKWGRLDVCRHNVVDTVTNIGTCLKGNEICYFLIKHNFSISHFDRYKSDYESFRKHFDPTPEDIIQREVEKAIKEEKEKKLAEERKKMDEITNKYKASSRLDKLKEKNNIK